MEVPEFLECHICHKEFGNESLPTHEEQCLKNLRKNNATLPNNARLKTPSPRTSRNPSRKSSDTGSSSSAPESPKRGRSATRKMRRKKTVKRPSTATLSEPKVLDVNLMNEIDMSQMSRQMLENLVLRKDETKTSSDYSSDFTSLSSTDSSSPKRSNSSSEEDIGEHVRRPLTMKLKNASNNISVPVVKTSGKAPLPRRGRTATLKKNNNNNNHKKRLSIADEILSARDDVMVPEPCLTCGKERKPERFHSHPPDPLAEKPKIKSDLTTIPKLAPRRRLTRSIPLKHKTVLTDSLVKKFPRGPQSMGNKLRKLSNLAYRHNKRNQVQRDQLTKDENSGGVTYRLGTNSKSRAHTEENSDTNRDEKSLQKSKKKMKGSKILNKQITNQEPSGLSETPFSVPLRLCYVCGRQFGSQSLSIHETQCLERWRRENVKLPQKLRRAEPKKPEGDLTKDEWNKLAWETSQSLLIACTNCGRTFFPERLRVHQAGCKKDSDESEQETKAVQRAPKSAKKIRRPTIICYICGREFGTKSIGIHEPQCLTKWRAENDKLPAKLRKPDPERPTIIYKADGKVDEEATSEAAWQKHLETLVKCEGCGRSFLPDRLLVHHKNCKALLQVT